ncbi:hypothetical protein EWM64_g10243 [Hericium alpestre]|uniref:DNA/RNA-binding domain-containing protein n=1 Tax=Hericium alpestre TaxID=135208 RepID=A0A4Y9ZK09_9AGAM|nr:hypothetical protein EWM64_g10243 [Hericium alpestre]
MESRIASHIVALHHALIKCADAELDESAKIAEDDLAMRITATLRRMLPALRVAGKWLLTNADYVFNNSSSRSAESEKPTVQINGVQALFEAYKAFALRLSSIFPPDDLPKLTRPLEEDIDLQGFLPLRGPLNDGAQGGQHLGNGIGSQVPGSDSSRSLEQVHPNEEQLMRIWDLWHNASTMAELRGSPIKAVAPPSRQADQSSGNGNAQVQRNGEAVSVVPAPPDWSAQQRWSKGRMPKEVEEDAKTEVTRTDDDPVGDAFRQALNISDEEEDDEIVWDPRAQTSPPGQPAAPAQHLAHIRTAPDISPTSPLSPVKASSAYSPISPMHPTSSTISPVSRPTSGPAPLISPKTTAQDLLNNVMAPKQALPGSHLGPRVPTHRGHLAQPSLNSPLSPQHVGSPLPPQLLFGGPQAGSGTAHSIWAAGPGEGSLLQHHRRPSGSIPLSSPPAGVHAASQSMSQVSWPSSFDRSSQAAHPQHFGVPPMDTFALAPGQNAHRRVPSAALPMSHNYLASGHNEPASYMPYAQSPAGFNPQVPFSRDGMDVNAGPGLSSDMFSDPALATVAGQPPQLPYSHPNQHHAFNTFDMSSYPGDRQQNVGGLWGRMPTAKNQPPFKNGISSETMFPKTADMPDRDGGPRCEVHYEDEGPLVRVLILDTEGQPHECLLPRVYALPLALLNKQIAFLEACASRAARRPRHAQADAPGHTALYVPLASADQVPHCGARRELQDPL